MASVCATRVVNKLCFALGLWLFAGCNWNNFEHYEEEAQIRVYPAPANYGVGEYGSVLATYHGTIYGAPVSRIIASAGRHSPVVITRAWDGRAPSEGALRYCRAEHECVGGQDVGATLIPFDSWGAASSDPRSGCVFAPSNASGAVVAGVQQPAGALGFVLCETDKAAQFFDLGIAAQRGAGESLQFSGFGLPRGHPLGVALLGVYARDDRNGERRRGTLYRQEDREPGSLAGGGARPLKPISLLDPATRAPFSAEPDVADFGLQVVGAFNAAEELVIAVAQPAKQRVIVASYDDRLSGDPSDKFVTRACVRAPQPALRGFGERLLLGDVDGDRAPELFVGVDPASGIEPGRQALFVYWGNKMPGPEAAREACPDWTAAADAVACQDGVNGAGCGGFAAALAPEVAGTGFGASLALGDIDGDGRGDLIVGAPLAQAGRGAVWIIPGPGPGDGAASTPSPIRIESPAGEGGSFGWAVAPLRTLDRDELVASAPGASEIFVFMCTALEPDFGAASLCLRR